MQFTTKHCFGQRCRIVFQDFWWWSGRRDAANAVVQSVQLATTLGYLLFGDVPDLATFAGAGIIIGAGLLLWSRTPARSPVKRPSGLTGPS